jgi:hypothetical protein
MLGPWGLVVIDMPAKNREVIDLLARTPLLPMPDHLAARIQAAIAAESARRSGERAARMRELGAWIEEALQRGDLEEAHELAEAGLIIARPDYDAFLA